MNIMARAIGEHPDVRLPVIVAYDGFFTSHQKRSVHILRATRRSCRTSSARAARASRTRSTRAIRSPSART